MQAKRLSPGEQPIPAAPRTARCVLLTPAAQPPEVGSAEKGTAQVLIDALMRRGLAVIVVNDPPRAMLELLRSKAAALIVADPERQTQAAQLIEAVRSARPHTVCWQFCRRQGRQTLEPINGRLGDVQIHTEPSTTEPDHASPVDQAEPVKPQPPAEPDEPLISADELAMLLGPPLEDES